MTALTWDPDHDPPNPIAVYGTLRPGCGNARLWQDRADAIGIGTVTGFELRTPGGFPYAVPTGHRDHRITVELIMPWQGRYQEVIDRMDVLEGVPHHYRRIEVAVDATLRHVTGTVFAWMYVPTDQARTAKYRKIESGDWLARDIGDWDADELVRRVVG